MFKIPFILRVFLTTTVISKVGGLSLESTNLAPHQIQVKSSPKVNLSSLPSIKVREVKSIGESATRFDIPIYNSSVILKKEMKRVELICESNHPIKWEYLVNDVNIPILEIQYRRILYGSKSNLKNVTQNFEGRVTLRGLLESQTGKYSCIPFNDKLTNNSYEKAVNLSIFVPGKRIFTRMPNIKYISKINTSVDINCPVSNPQVGVDLYKLDEYVFNQTNQQKWDHVDAKFEPMLGFHLNVHTLREKSLFGTYRCVAHTVGRETFITVHVADESVKKSLYDSVASKNIPCWESQNCMKLLRSLRLECNCKDAYGLFTNNLEGKEENRKKNCTDLSTSLEPFKEMLNRDWRTEEYLRNGEEGQELCFRDNIRSNINGTGARVLLRLIANNPDEHAHPNSSATRLLNLTVRFDGLPGWASGFRIGLERFPKINEPASEERAVEILDKEPTHTQFYPLAHYTAVWENLLVDPMQVNRIHVFQPDSLSYEWFQISSELTNATLIGNVDEMESNPKKEESCGKKVFCTFQTLELVLLIVACISALFMAVGFFFYKRRKRTVKFYPGEKVGFIKQTFPE